MKQIGVFNFPFIPNEKTNKHKTTAYAGVS